MPMNEVGIAGVVDDVDPDWLSFTQPQRSTRHRTVVSGRLDDLIGRDLKRNRRDLDGVVDVLCGA